MPKIKNVSLASDGHVQALLDFNMTGYFRDKMVGNLLLRIGKKRDRASWYFSAEHQRRGKRIISHQLLGHWPKMNVRAARIEAEKLAGSIATSGPASQIKFATALDDYLTTHLDPKVARKGNALNWARTVRSLSRKYLLPEWGAWTLADMSASPKEVRDWHLDLSKTVPASANHCAAVIRACYKHMRKLERGLPADLPTSAVVWNEENPRQIAITDWSAWADSWRAIPDKEQRAFQILNLLGGFRPGELSGLRWDHVDCKRRLITIRAAKAGADIASPMSWPIAKALRMARNAIKEAGNDGPLVFPSVAVRRGADGLPVWGQGLRHSYATVAAELETDEVIRHCLLGHALRGVSRGYLARFVLQNSAAMRRAQAKISHECLRRLDLSNELLASRCKLSAIPEKGF